MIVTDPERLAIGGNLINGSLLIRFDVILINLIYLIEVVVR